MSSWSRFCGTCISRKRQEKGESVSTTQDEKTVEPAAREQKPVEPQLEVDAEAKGQQPTDEQTEQGASSKPRRRRHRGGRSSHAETAAEKTTPQNEDAKAEVSSGQPKRQPAKESKSDRPQKQASMPKRERNSQGDSKRKSQKKPESAAVDTAAHLCWGLVAQRTAQSRTTLEPWQNLALWTKARRQTRLRLHGR